MDVILNLIDYLKKNPQGSLLHDENEDLFQQWHIELQNKKTEGQNKFEYLKDLTEFVQGVGDIQFKLEELELQFKYYQGIYNRLNSNLELSISQVTASTLELLQQFREKDNTYLSEKNQIVWTSNQKTSLVEILAHISAAWTLIDCVNKSQNGRRYVHTVQIVTIMRLINIDTQQTSRMYNQIAQVRTGEGKSIALGITSTILALLGFKINCCCYSQYLSDRDYKGFEKFFRHFNVADRIKYGTFFQLTEQMINHPQDLRVLGENFIKGIEGRQMQQDDSQNSKSILIIDEVDFFFSDTFLGQVYAVGYQYTNQEVVNLFTLIWKKKYRYLTLQKVKITEEYKNLFNRNPYLFKLQDIIDNKINQMLEDAKKMDKHCYFLQKDLNQERLIGYKEMDGMTFGVNKGYRTAYAYCQEYERRKISREYRNTKLSFNFNIGCFSYPMVTKNYNLVLGVTGTLEHMSDFQKDLMKSMCQISKTTITPSIYGKSKFVFNEQTDVLNAMSLNEYYTKITEQVKNCLKQNRSILIFFNGQQNLLEYQKHISKELIDIQYNLSILHEQTVDKQVKINQAADCKVVTLTTKSFGRGTDFKCFSTDLINNGGIHAIQTFFSETLAEEIQIKGRVARNGDPGSYSMILLNSDLEEAFSIKMEVPQDQSLYKYLHGLRTDKSSINDKKVLQKQKDTEDIHNQSIILKDHLQKMGKLEDGFIQILNKLSIYGDSKDLKINNQNIPNAYKQLDQKNINDAQKDRFNNPFGDEYDLVVQGSLNDKSLIIGQFCVEEGCDLTADVQNQLRTSIRTSGFNKFDVFTDEEQFIQQLDQYDQIWILCGIEFTNQSAGIEKRFVDAVLKQLKQKKGLFLLADNYPYVYHANLILQKLPIGFEDNTPIHMNLQGNDRANNILLKGAFDQQLQFGTHLITNSLQQIYEGNTICYPKIVGNGKKYDSYDDFYDIEIIGTSQTKKPCIFVLNGNNKRGRIVFDCGLTKLMRENWSTAGTERYFQNCYAWLYFLDSEIPK